MSDGEGACDKKKKSKLGTEEHVFNPTLSRQRHEGLCEPEVNPAYILNVKLASNTKLDTVFKR